MDRQTLDLLASYAKLKSDAYSLALHHEKIIPIEKFATAIESVKGKKTLTVAK